MPTDRDSPRRTGMLPPTTSRDSLRLRPPSPSVGTETSFASTKKRGRKELFASDFDDSDREVLSASIRSTSGPASTYAQSVISTVGDSTSVLGSTNISPLRKSKKARMVPTALSDRIKKLRQLIVDCDSLSEDALSDPKKFLELPYPSTVRKPPGGFDLDVRDGIGWFKFMGRENFREVCDAVKFFTEEPSVVSHDRGTYYLEGSAGIGKSYILAALACLLVHQEQNVFYIPSCRDLVKSPLVIFKELLSFTFPDRHIELRGIPTIEGIMSFAEGLSEIASVICIIDDYDALFNTDLEVDSKSQVAVKDILNLISANHFRITTCSSAYPIWGPPIGAKRFVRMFGGLSKLEMEMWWLHNNDRMPSFVSESEKEEVEYETGRLPFLLQSLFEYSGRPFEAVRNAFMKCKRLATFRSNVRDLIRRQLKELNKDPDDRNLYISVLKSCIQDTNVHDADTKDLFDQRYFYFNDNRGYSACGIARDAVSKVLFQTQSELLQGVEWISAINNSSSNPSLKGFLTEIACLSYISTRGLKFVDNRLDAMLTSQFTDVPNFSKLDSSEKTNRHLFIPYKYNYAAIDGVIVLLDNVKMALDFFPIQITIAKKHSDSETGFFENWWSKYYYELPGKYKEDYSISVKFIWIEKDPEIVTDEPKRAPITGIGLEEYKVFKIPLNRVHSDFILLT